MNPPTSIDHQKHNSESVLTNLMITLQEVWFPQPYSSNMSESGNFLKTLLWKNDLHLHSMLIQFPSWYKIPMLCNHRKITVHLFIKLSPKQHISHCKKNLSVFFPSDHRKTLLLKPLCELQFYTNSSKIVSTCQISTAWLKIFLNINIQKGYQLNRHNNSSTKLIKIFTFYKAFQLTCSKVAYFTGFKL